MDEPFKRASSVTLSARTPDEKELTENEKLLLRDLQIISDELNPSQFSFKKQFRKIKNPLKKIIFFFNGYEIRRKIYKTAEIKKMQRIDQVNFDAIQNASNVSVEVISPVKKLSKMSKTKISGKRESEDKSVKDKKVRLIEEEVTDTSNEKLINLHQQHQKLNQLRLDKERFSLRLRLAILIVIPCVLFPPAILMAGLVFAPFFWWREKKKGKIQQLKKQIVLNYFIKKDMEKVPTLPKKSNRSPVYPYSELFADPLNITAERVNKIFGEKIETLEECNYSYTVKAKKRYKLEKYWEILGYKEALLCLKAYVVVKNAYWISLNRNNSVDNGPFIDYCKKKFSVYACTSSFYRRKKNIISKNPCLKTLHTSIKKVLEEKGGRKQWVFGDISPTVKNLNSVGSSSYSGEEIKRMSDSPQAFFPPQGFNVCSSKNSSNFSRHIRRRSTGSVKFFAESYIDSSGSDEGLPPTLSSEKVILTPPLASPLPAGDLQGGAISPRTATHSGSGN